MRSLLVAALLLLPAGAFALMPPHFRSSEPADGETLTSNVITLHGYTLDVAEKDVKVTTAEGEAVPFTASTTCEWVGEGDMPGARQNKCTMRLELQKAPPGATLKVELWRSSVTVNVPEKGLPAEAGETKTAPAATEMSDPPGKAAPAAAETPARPEKAAPAGQEAGAPKADPPE